MKLTIISAWRARLSRVNRWNCRALVLTLPSIGSIPSPRARGRRPSPPGPPSPRPPPRDALLLVDLALLGFLGLLQLLAHLQRPRQPEEGVGPADHEGAHEEARHAPEGPVEPGVLLRVVVRGVAQVAREAAGGPGVALLAGLDHVLPREVRAGVGDPLDVVGAVAVVALGRLRVAELADLAVVGVEVGLRDLAVAAAALLHDVELESVGVRPLDGVRAVAVVADRELLVGLPRSAWWMLRSNSSWMPWWQRPQVAGTFCAVDARGGVGARQDAVGGVAARAGGGHGEAALQQPLAVDALRVGLDDLVLRAPGTAPPPARPRGGSGRTAAGRSWRRSARSSAGGPGSRGCRGTPCTTARWSRP